MRSKKKLKAAPSSSSDSQSGVKTETKYGIEHFFAPRLTTPQTIPNPTIASPPNPVPNIADVDDAIFIDKEEVTPKPSKFISRLRHSQTYNGITFSPGMLINQSQDDGVGDEITWKVSPVNQRLHSMRPCSLIPSFHEAISSSETSKSIPVHETAPPTVSSVPPYHSPFTTPPSLSNSNTRLPPIQGSGAISNLPSQHHKKALIDLLDQLGDAFSCKDLVADEIATTSMQLEAVACKKLTDDQCSVENSCTTLENLTASFGRHPFLVLEVFEKSGPSDLSEDQFVYKVLRLLDEQTGEERAANLCDEWLYTSISPGDTVNVIGEFDDRGECCVGESNNFIIVHPEILISGTRVAASFSCPRRSVLDERVKCNENSTSALIGTLLHQMFQAALSEENPSVKYMEEFAKCILNRNIESLYACGVNEKDMLNTLVDAIPKILNWISLFRDAPDSEKSVVDFGSDFGQRNLNIREVIDIEEAAWAPNFGLKGIIDASLRAHMQNGKDDVDEIILPLELKTGKIPSGQSSVEHCAQVILYTLLMSERYLKKIEYGLLCYLQSNQTQGIHIKRSDTVGLIMRRNELASDILKAITTQKLPPMLRRPSTCRSCRHLDVCSVYHKVEGGNAESSGLGDTFNSLAGHLTLAHCSFLQSWEQLIDLESRETQPMKHYDIVRSDNSVSAVLDNSAGLPCEQSPKSNKYIYRFRHQTQFSNQSQKSGEPPHPTTPSSDLDYKLKCGDFVILSTESGHKNVANGVVRDTSRSHILVSFPKRLRLPGKGLNSGINDLSHEVWRIDKDEVKTSFAVMRSNLVRLFLSNSHSSHLRKMIVDLEAPRFDSGCIISQDPAVSYIWSVKSLNNDQRRSIFKILAAKDYALILGMPGTGKTSTMAHAVKALLIRGASILLTSYTNSAVDNLLIKLKTQGIDFLRIGRPEVIHEAVREHCFSAMDVKSVEMIQSRLDTVKVVAVTCMGMTNPLLANKMFDVCIMDEAGQISLPIALGPLMHASMFVLVGDHYQLPPLVKSAVARENGMGSSLFCRLSEACSEAISALRSQYRMCQPIMDLANSLIYGNRLRCGSSDVANAKLKCSICEVSSPWLKDVLNPSNAVVFINTDNLSAFESKEFRTVHNPTETYLISKVASELIRLGIECEDIGIVTPYNAQANYIRVALNMDSVEIHTIDKYQGRDKDCMLISFVRSQERPRNFVSSILSDWHRINVAITRAKKKLIMVGSSTTLSMIPLLKLLIEKVDELSGCIDVSKDDLFYGADEEAVKLLSKKLNLNN